MARLASLLSQHPLDLARQHGMKVAIAKVVATRPGYHGGGETMEVRGQNVWYRLHEHGEGEIRLREVLTWALHHLGVGADVMEVARSAADAAVARGDVAALAAALAAMGVPAEDGRQELAEALLALTPQVRVRRLDQLEVVNTSEDQQAAVVERQRRRAAVPARAVVPEREPEAAGTVPQFGTIGELARYIAGDDRRKAGAISDVVRGRITNSPPELTEQQLHKVRAAIAGRGRTPREFDLGRAREALQRLVDKDPTLPANSLGQRIQISEDDPNDTRIRFRGGVAVPRDQRIVTGRVVEIKRGFGGHGLTLVIKRDGGPDEGGGYPRATTQVAADAVLTLVGPRAVLPTAITPKEPTVAREIDVPPSAEQGGSPAIPRATDAAPSPGAPAAAPPRAQDEIAAAAPQVAGEPAGLPGMTPARRTLLEHAVQDYLAWHGARSSSASSPDNAAGYLVRRHVPNGTAEEQAWIADYIRAHPELRQGKALTQAELQQRRDARAEQAGDLSRRAHEACQARDYGRALELIGEAEVTEPRYAEHWGKVRAHIETERARAARTMSGEAFKAYQNRDYDRALQLIDDAEAAYPQQENWAAIRTQIHTARGGTATPEGGPTAPSANTTREDLQRGVAGTGIVPEAVATAAAVSVEPPASPAVLSLTQRVQEAIAADTSGGQRAQVAMRAIARLAGDPNMEVARQIGRSLLIDYTRSTPAAAGWYGASKSREQLPRGVTAVDIENRLVAMERMAGVLDEIGMRPIIVRDGDKRTTLPDALRQYVDGGRRAMRGEPVPDTRDARNPTPQTLEPAAPQAPATDRAEPASTQRTEPPVNDPPAAPSASAAPEAVRTETAASGPRVPVEPADLPGMTPARRAQIVHAVEDHAATYGGRNSPTPGGASAARYVFEGHVAGGTREEWDWIADYIAAHPELLQRPAYTQAELADRRQKRTRAADTMSTDAYAAFQARDYDRALQLIDSASVTDPERGELWDQARAQIDAARSQTAPAVTPESTSTPHRPYSSEAAQEQPGPAPQPEPAAPEEATPEPPVSAPAEPVVTPDEDLMDRIAEAVIRHDEVRSAVDYSFKETLSDIRTSHRGYAGDGFFTEVKGNKVHFRLRGVCQGTVKLDKLLQWAIDRTELDDEFSAEAEQLLARDRELLAQGRGIGDVEFDAIAQRLYAIGQERDRRDRRDPALPDYVGTRWMRPRKAADNLAAPNQDTAEPTPEVQVTPQAPAAPGMAADPYSILGPAPTPAAPQSGQAAPVSADLAASVEPDASAAPDPSAHDNQEGPRTNEPAGAGAGDVGARIAEHYALRNVQGARRVSIRRLDDSGVPDGMALYRVRARHPSGNEFGTWVVLINNRLAAARPDTRVAALDEASWVQRRAAHQVAADGPVDSDLPEDLQAAQRGGALLPAPAAPTGRTATGPRDDLTAEVDQLRARQAELVAQGRGIDDAEFDANAQRLRAISEERNRRAFPNAPENRSTHSEPGAPEARETDGQFLDGAAQPTPALPPGGPDRPTEDQQAAAMDALHHATGQQREPDGSWPISDDDTVYMARWGAAPAFLRGPVDEALARHDAIRPPRPAELAPQPEQGERWDRIRAQIDSARARKLARQASEGGDNSPAAPEPAPAAPVSLDLPAALRSRGLTTVPIADRDGWQSVERADGTVVAIRDAARNYVTDTDPDAPRIPPARLTAYFDALTAGPLLTVSLTGTDRRRVLDRVSPPATPEAHVAAVAQTAPNHLWPIGPVAASDIGPGMRIQLFGESDSRTVAHAAPAADPRYIHVLEAGGGRHTLGQQEQVRVVGGTRPAPGQDQVPAAPMPADMTLADLTAEREQLWQQLMRRYEVTGPHPGPVEDALRAIAPGAMWWLDVLLTARAAAAGAEPLSTATPQRPSSVPAGAQEIRPGAQLTDTPAPNADLADMSIAELEAERRVARNTEPRTEENRARYQAINARLTELREVEYQAQMADSRVGQIAHAGNNTQQRGERISGWGADTLNATMDAAQRRIAANPRDMEAIAARSAIEAIQQRRAAAEPAVERPAELVTGAQPSSELPAALRSRNLTVEPIDSGTQALAGIEPGWRAVLRPGRTVVAVQDPQGNYLTGTNSDARRIDADQLDRYLDALVGDPQPAFRNGDVRRDIFDRIFGAPAPEPEAPAAGTADGPDPALMSRRDIDTERTDLFRQFMERYAEAGNPEPGEGEAIGDVMARVAPELNARINARILALAAEADARDRGEGYTGLTPGQALAGRVRDRLMTRNLEWTGFDPEDAAGVARALRGMARGLPDGDEVAERVADEIDWAARDMSWREGRYDAAAARQVEQFGADSAHTRAERMELAGDLLDALGIQQNASVYVRRENGRDFRPEGNSVQQQLRDQAAAYRRAADGADAPEASATPEPAGPPAAAFAVSTQGMSARDIGRLDKHLNDHVHDRRTGRLIRNRDLYARDGVRVAEFPDSRRPADRYRLLTGASEDGDRYAPYLRIPKIVFDAARNAEIHGPDPELTPEPERPNPFAAQLAEMAQNPVAPPVPATAEPSSEARGRVDRLAVMASNEQRRAALDAMSDAEFDETVAAVEWRHNLAVARNGDDVPDPLHDLVSQVRRDRDQQSEAPAEPEAPAAGALVPGTREGTYTSGDGRFEIEPGRDEGTWLVADLESPRRSGGTERYGVIAHGDLDAVRDLIERRRAGTDPDSVAVRHGLQLDPTPVQGMRSFTVRVADPRTRGRSRAPERRATLAAASDDGRFYTIPVANEFQREIPAELIDEYLTQATADPIALPPERFDAERRIQLLDQITPAEPEVTPEPERPTAPGLPSPDLLAELEVRGRAAYESGSRTTAIAPALDPAVQEALQGRPVGDPGARAIMEAYTRGRDQAADEAARRATQPEPTPAAPDVTPAAGNVPEVPDPMPGASTPERNAEIERLERDLRAARRVAATTDIDNRDHRRELRERLEGIRAHRHAVVPGQGGLFDEPAATPRVSLPNPVDADFAGEYRLQDRLERSARAVDEDELRTAFRRLGVPDDEIEDLVNQAIDVNPDVIGQAIKDARERIADEDTSRDVPVADFLAGNPTPFEMAESLGEQRPAHAETLGGEVPGEFAGEVADALERVDIERRHTETITSLRRRGAVYEALSRPEEPGPIPDPASEPMTENEHAAAIDTALNIDTDPDAAQSLIREAQAAHPGAQPRWAAIMRQARGLHAVPSDTPLDDNGDIIEPTVDTQGQGPAQPPQPQTGTTAPEPSPALEQVRPQFPPVLFGPGTINHFHDLRDRLTRRLVGGAEIREPGQRDAIVHVASWLRDENQVRVQPVPEPLLQPGVDRLRVADAIEALAVELAGRNDTVRLRYRRDPGTTIAEDLHTMAGLLRQGRRQERAAEYRTNASRVRNSYFTPALRDDLLAALRDLGSADPHADADYISNGDGNWRQSSSDRMRLVLDRLNPDTGNGAEAQSPYSRTPASAVAPASDTVTPASAVPTSGQQSPAAPVKPFALPLDTPMRLLLAKNVPTGKGADINGRRIEVTDHDKFGAHLDRLRDHYEAVSQRGSNRAENRRLYRAAVRLRQSLDQHIAQLAASQPAVAPAIEPVHEPAPTMAPDVTPRTPLAEANEPATPDIEATATPELEPAPEASPLRGGLVPGVLPGMWNAGERFLVVSDEADRYVVLDQQLGGDDPHVDVVDSLDHAGRLIEQRLRGTDSVSIAYRHGFRVDSYPNGADPGWLRVLRPEPGQPESLVALINPAGQVVTSPRRLDETVTAEEADEYLRRLAELPPTVRATQQGTHILAEIRFARASGAPSPTASPTAESSPKTAPAELGPQRPSSPEAGGRADEPAADDAPAQQAEGAQPQASEPSPGSTMPTAEQVRAHVASLPTPPPLGPNRWRNPNNSLMYRIAVCVVDPWEIRAARTKGIAEVLPRINESRRILAGPGQQTEVRSGKVHFRFEGIGEGWVPLRDVLTWALDHASDDPAEPRISLDVSAGLAEGDQLVLEPVHPDAYLPVRPRDRDLTGGAVAEDKTARAQPPTSAQEIAATDQPQPRPAPQPTIDRQQDTDSIRIAHQHGFTVESYPDGTEPGWLRVLRTEPRPRPDAPPGQTLMALINPVGQVVTSINERDETVAADEVEEYLARLAGLQRGGTKVLGRGSEILADIRAARRESVPVTPAGRSPAARSAEPSSLRPSPAEIAGARFRPTSQADLAPSGSMARVRANIAALQTIRTIQDEQRHATADEQAVLARWSGWGAVPAVFDTDRADYAWAREQLDTLLDPAERKAAQRNTLNAHYTDLSLVAPIWSALQELGFTGGRVLEPGCGSGNFIGAAPDGAEMVGVEVEPITAAIAAELYPDAQILAESFADTRAPEGAFDLVVGNVPFAKTKLLDREHNHGRRHSMHNHFPIKSMHLVAPGGLVAVITSRYTLDAQNPTARQEMAALADLVGAIRLPQAAHQRAAGTQVVTDLLVFRRREPDREPAPVDWERTELATIDGQEAEVNSYFLAHPEMVCGELAVDRGQFSDAELTVRADRPAPELLAEKLAILVERARAAELTHSPTGDRASASRVALVANSSSSLMDGHLLVDGEAFAQINNGVAVPFKAPTTQHAELRAMIGMRDTVAALLQAEATSVEPTPEIEDLRTRLNAQYDAYVGRYGPLNRFKWGKTGHVDAETNEPIMRRIPAPQGGFRTDPGSSLVYALENFDSSTQRATKADIFAQRVIALRAAATGAESPADALAICMDLHGRVDLDEIGRLLRLTAPEAREALGQLVFEDPAQDGQPLLPAAEYLSENVRKKLAAARAAAADDPRFEPNVAALVDVVPLDLAPEEIVARLGAPWIDESYVQQFLREVLEDPRLVVEHAYGADWTVKGNKYSVTATSTWGTEDCPATEIAQRLLEQRAVTVYETIIVDGSERSVISLAKSTAAQAKADELGERFSAWVWEDPQRATKLARIYNDRFNSWVLRNYDDVKLSFPGLAWGFKPNPHQVAAVARMRSDPAVGLWHEVGAGKTAEMAMGVMELRRLGMVRKPVIVIPNHMLEQFRNEFQQLYPQAKLLAASSDDLKKEKRRAFVARVATNDWDAVIMTRGAFERIPMSPDAQAAYFEAELDALRAAIERRKASAKEEGRRSLTLKRMETQLENAEERLKEKHDRKYDPALTFEQSGIDYVVVDEGQDYKNLRTASNIEGAAIEPGSKRAADLDMKLHYLRNRHGKRVVTIATATPIMNSITEAHVMQRYLRPDLLAEAGVLEFDMWAATFGRVVTEPEVSPDLASFRMKSRFARFHNVPELLRMWWASGDVKTAEDLNLPRPELRPRSEDGKRLPETVVLPPYTGLPEFIDQLAVMAEKARTARTKEDKKIYNMLRVTNLGRAAAIDMRLVGLPMPAGESKAEVVADGVARDYHRHKDDRFTDPSGAEHPVPGAFQLVFCDYSTPSTDGRWNFYDELRTQLIARGVPAEKIRYIHEARNDKEKAELFQGCRTGQVSVMIASTSKVGVGTNVQDRLVSMHHADVPWRPGDLTQRDGRGLRRGNQYKEIGIYRYVVERSFDAYFWQGIARKARFIAQLMRGRLDVREIEDIGDAALSANEVKAVAAGNPLLLEKAKADADLNRLDRLERAHFQARSRLRSSIDQNELTIKRLDRDISAIEAAITRRRDTRAENFRMVIDGRTYDDRAEAGQALRDRLAVPGQTLDQPANPFSTVEGIAELGGLTFDATIWHSRMRDGYELRIAGIRGSVEGVSGSRTQLLESKLPSSLPIRMENRLEALDRDLTSAREAVQTCRDEIDRAHKQIEQPFAYGDALEAARQRVAEIDREIGDLAAPPPLPPADGSAAEGTAEAEETRAPERRTPPTPDRDRPKHPALTAAATMKRPPDRTGSPADRSAAVPQQGATSLVPPPRLERGGSVNHHPPAPRR